MSASNFDAKPPTGERWLLLLRTTTSTHQRIADFDTVREAEADTRGELAGWHDDVAGLGAFMKKRAPEFTGS